MQVTSDRAHKLLGVVLAVTAVVYVAGTVGALLWLR